MGINGNCMLDFADFCATLPNMLMKVWMNTHFYFCMGNDIMYIVKK